MKAMFACNLLSSSSVSSNSISSKVIFESSTCLSVSRYNSRTITRNKVGTYVPSDSCSRYLDRSRKDCCEQKEKTVAYDIDKMTKDQAPCHQVTLQNFSSAGFGNWILSIVEEGSIDDDGEEFFRETLNS
jgi:hypothetical protein